MGDKDEKNADNWGGGGGSARVGYARYSCGVQHQVCVAVVYMKLTETCVPPPADRTLPAARSPTGTLAAPCLHEAARCKTTWRTRRPDKTETETGTETEPKHHDAAATNKPEGRKRKERNGQYRSDNPTAASSSSPAGTTGHKPQRTHLPKK